MQLYVFAAAALLMAAVLAVTLTAGPASGPGHHRPGRDAQDRRQRGGVQGSSAPSPAPRRTLPDASTVDIISEGYYAVFDAFWDYEDGHPSNNFCPPEVTVTTEEVDPEDEEETVYTRSNADIHISKTAFSIPDSYKVTVIDSRNPTTVNGNPDNVTGDTIDIADFPFLAQDNAVSAVKTEGRLDRLRRQYPLVGQG